MFGYCKTSLTALACLAFSAGSIHAAFVDEPLPSGAYIQFDGLDWAWANPVAADGSYVPLPGEPGPGFTGVDLSHQSRFGWRFATAEELRHAPTAMDFIFAGANVPAPGGGPDPVSGADSSFIAPGPTIERPGPMACATPYFSSWTRNCNWQNGPGSGEFFTSTDWWQPGGPAYAETLVVRAINPVPEPGTWLLMGVGLAALALGAAGRT